MIRAALVEQRLNWLLMESRLDFVKKKWAETGVSTDHDDMADHTHHEAIIDNIAATADPSKNKKYTDRITHWYHKGHFRQEDHPRVREAVQAYETHRKKLKKQDLNQYKTFSELETAVEPHAGSDERSVGARRKERERAIKDNGSEVMHSDDKLEVREIKSRGAMRILGRGTKWCTTYASKRLNQHNAMLRQQAAGRGENDTRNAKPVEHPFDQYTKRGPLYFIHDKERNEKYLTHFESGSFKNAQDEPGPHDVMGEDGKLAREVAGRHPVLYDLFQGRHYDILSHRGQSDQRILSGEADTQLARSAARYSENPEVLNKLLGHDDHEVTGAVLHRRERPVRPVDYTNIAWGRTDNPMRELDSSALHGLAQRLIHQYNEHEDAGRHYEADKVGSHLNDLLFHRSVGEHTHRLVMREHRNWGQVKTAARGLQGDFQPRSVDAEEPKSDAEKEANKYQFDKTTPDDLHHLAHRAATADHEAWKARGDASDRQKVGVEGPSTGRLIFTGREFGPSGAHAVTAHVLGHKDTPDDALKLFAKDEWIPGVSRDVEGPAAIAGHPNASRETIGLTLNSHARDRKSWFAAAGNANADPAMVHHIVSHFKREYDEADHWVKQNREYDLGDAFLKASENPSAHPDTLDMIHDHLIGGEGMYKVGTMERLARNPKTSDKALDDILAGKYREHLAGWHEDEHDQILKDAAENKRRRARA